MVPHPGHSDTLTQGIRVRVGGQLVAQQSDPSLGRWTYAYRVILDNLGEERARLRSRHWIITDAEGETREVRGSGVVGDHPELGPGETYEYVSGVQLHTEWGTMEGSYQFERPDGSRFEARIGRFFLAPNAAPLSLLDEEDEEVERIGRREA